MAQSSSEYIHVLRRYTPVENFNQKLQCQFFKPVTLTSNITKHDVGGTIQGSCKKFCHWVPITSVLRFIKYIFITNLQSILPLLKHIFVTFLPSREKQMNSLLLVSVGDTDK